MTETPPATSETPSPRPRGPRRRRWPWWLGAACALVLSICLLGAWLLATESGARMALGVAQERLPGSLRVESVSGTLGGRLALTGVDWRLDGGTRLRAARLRADWQPTGLLSGQWQLGEVGVRELRIETDTGADGADDGAAPTDWDGLLAAVVAWPIHLERVTLAPVELDLDGELHRLERVTFRGTSRVRAVDVRELRIEHALGALKASGSLAPGAQPPIRIELAWHVQPPDGPRFAASGELTGTFDRLEVEQSFGAPAAGRVSGTLEQPLDAPRARLRADLPKIELSRLWPGLPAWPAEAGVDVRARADGFVAFEGSSRVEAGPLGRAEVRISGARVASEVWRASDIVIRREADGARVTGRGLLDLGAAAGPGFSGSMEWRGIGWPLTGLDEGAGGLQLPGSSGRAAVHAGTDGLRLRGLEASWLDGSWSGRAALGWDPKITGRFDLRAESVSPAALPGELPGKLDASFAGAVEWTEDAWRGELVLRRLHGDVLNAPVEASAEVATDGTGLQAEAVTARWGGVQATLSGRLGDDWDVDWDVQADGLEPWLADLEGSLDLSGSVEGPRRLPRLRLRGEGRGIGFAGYRMETARVRASVDMAAPGAVEAEAAGAGVRGPLVEGSDGRLRLSLEGDLERQSLRLETSDAERALRASLEGGFQDSPDSWRAVTGSRWAGRLTGLRISDPSLGDWDLDDPAELRAARDAISLAEGCLLGGEASLCVEGEWRPGPEGDWRARAELDGLGWSRLRELWPPGLGLGGSASVTATARGRGESPEALSIEARSGPGHLSWTADGTTGRVDHQGATLSLAADEGGARGRAEWDLGPLGGLEAELRAEAPSPGVGAFERLKARPLEAAASVRLESLSALDPFLEALQDVDGRLNGTLRVAGSWQEPRPSGRLQLQEAQARVPALGTTWEQIELTARTAGAHRIELEGSGRCGEGTANVVGEARLAESGEPELSLEIRGERVTLLDRPEAWLLADPELTVALRPDRIAVNGSVTVPEGKLDIEEGQGAPVESSPDVVVVRGERPVEPESSALPQMLEVHVRVELGDSVAVTGQGLDARLAGALEIDQEPGQPLPTGDGVIRIEDGEYKAYGRKLELRRGRLMFQGGPVDDPALDVVAAREAEDGTLAGVRISGRASAPEIALWSRPELADEEALSYLLFGRPQDATASKSEQGVFQRAAASLGLGGGSMLVKQLGKPLGLDKAKIEPGGTLQDAALVLGKYLSPRLYVAYGVGLFEPVNSFRLRYMLTPHWTLEAQSGEGAGGDLLYVIERPKP